MNGILLGMLEAGARGYVLKSDVVGQLLEAIESLTEHKPFFTAIVSETLLGCIPDAAETRPHWSRAIGTELVVRLIAEGHANRQVATILGVSLKTVEN